MRLLENLTELLKENNMNRTELAKQIGVAPSTINSWFSRNCENITLSNLIKISKFFNITIDELVHGYSSEVVIFDDLEYSQEELDIIKKFGFFLIENRLKTRLHCDIRPFSELEKTTRERNKLEKAK